MPESMLLKQWTQDAVAKAEHQKDLNHLLLCLEERFPGKVSTALQRSIKKQKDSAILENWLRIFARATTLAEFRANAGI